jgi:hypothetical protein
VSVKSGIGPSSTAVVAETSPTCVAAGQAPAVKSAVEHRAVALGSPTRPGGNSSSTALTFCSFVPPSPLKSSFRFRSLWAPAAGLAGPPLTATPKSA